MLLWGFGALVILLLAYIRLAPTDVARWHVHVTGTEDKDLTGGALRVIEGDRATFAALEEIAMATPRTEKIAGSAEEGLMTFRTRSLLMGYPDYTTAALEGDQIRLLARLRFGRSDMGVNRARLERWIDQLKR